MPTLLSPGVAIVEEDLTNIIPTVSTSAGALAGKFVWGPALERVLIESESDLVNIFGKPNDDVASDWFTASNFLAYGNTLYVVRAIDTDNANTALRTVNATAANSHGILVKNDDDYATNWSTGLLKSEFGTGPFIAKYPGVLGNSLKVSVCSGANAYQSTISGTVTVAANSTAVAGGGTDFVGDLVVGDLLVIANETHRVASITSTTALVLDTRQVTAVTSNTAIRRWEYYDEVNVAPSTSAYVDNLGGSNDEMHIAVVDEDGLWTGLKGSVLEVFQHVSKAKDATQENGLTNYYVNVLNNESKYVRWAGQLDDIANIGDTASGTAFGSVSKPTNFSFVGGYDGSDIGTNNKMDGFDLFASTEDVDIALVMGSDATQTIATYLINDIAEEREDCVAFLSPPQAYAVNNAGNEVTDIVNYRNVLPSSSYAVLDSGWKYQYDRYNDLYRYVPLNGDIAGLHVRTDQIKDPWWPAGGFNRGQIKNVTKLSWNPRQADRDVLYKNGINPVATFPGMGTVLYGNKTLLSKPSAFDRINVRRLFIILEKAISQAAKYMLFEINDEFSQAQFVNMVTPYLRDVQGRRGIYNFKVICDSTVNTQQVVDSNQFIGVIMVQPARAIEFITLKFVATPTGVDFSTFIGQV